jgi:hypothetical protein
MEAESYEERVKRQARERKARHRERQAQSAPLRHPGEAEKRWEGQKMAVTRPGHSSRCGCAVCKPR